MKVKMDKSPRSNTVDGNRNVVKNNTVNRGPVPIPPQLKHNSIGFDPPTVVNMEILEQDSAYAEAKNDEVRTNHTTNKFQLEKMISELFVSY